MTEVKSRNREHWAETASRTVKLGVKIHKIWGNWRKSKGLGILVEEEDVKGEVHESEFSVAKVGPLSHQVSAEMGKVKFRICRGLVSREKIGDQNSGPDPPANVQNSRKQTGAEGELCLQVCG